jgi:hypothetical protein
MPHIFVDPWGSLQQAPRNYCNIVGRYPAPIFGAYVLVLVCFIIALVKPVTINTDLGSFNQVESPTSSNYTVYRAALQKMRAVKNQSSLADRTTFQLEIFYHAKKVEKTNEDGEVISESEGSVFSEAALRDIRTFENTLKRLPGWMSLCGKSDERARFRCEPGESLGNYIWPVRHEDDLETNGYFKLGFDGQAREQLPTTAVLTYLAGGAALPHDPSKFLPQTFGGASSSSALLRSVFTFTEPKINDEAFATAYKEFVADSLYPELEDAVARAKKEVEPDTWDEPMHVLISFRGDVVDDHEVRTILQNDMNYAFAALIFMWMILWAQLRSLFLSSLGIFIIFLAILTTYGVIHLEQVSLVSFLSVFIVVGLGSNALIVIDDRYHRARREFPGNSPDQMTERLMHCYAATFWWLMPVFFTSCTFFVHLFSDMRPMREFGLFCGAAMHACSLLCLGLFVPLLIVHQEFVRPLIVRKCPKPLAMVLEPAKLPINFFVKKITAYIMKAARKSQNVIIGTAVVSLICIIAAAATATARESSGLPEVFPPTHHRSASIPQAKTFAPAKSSELQAPANATICEPSHSTSTGATCGLHWCEAPLVVVPDVTVNATTITTADPMVECTCYKKTTAATTKCGVLDIQASVSGPNVADIPDAALSEALKAYVLAEWSQASAVNDILNDQVPPQLVFPSRRLPSLVLEHWESGLTDIESFKVIPRMRITQKFFNWTAVPPNKNEANCLDHAICYCGPRVCTNPGASFGSSTAKLNLNTTIVPSRRLLTETDDFPVWDPDPAYAPDSTPGRRLAAASSFQQTTTTEVVVIYGIVPPTSSWSLGDGPPDWTFDSKFNAESPWAQRALLDMCEGGVDGRPRLVDIAALKVVPGGQNCWISDFKKFMYSKGQKFPTERFVNFHDALARFIVDYEGAASHMWFDEQAKLVATSLHIKVRLASSQYKILEDQKAWLDYVHSVNERAYTYADSAWPTSQAWVDAEAYVEALWGAWKIVLLAVLGIIISGLAFTLDMLIMTCIVLVSLVCCTGLAFLMFCVFSWTVGPWEIIILTVFMGYSVEPAFRLGRDFVFGDKDEKLKEEPEEECSDAVDPVDLTPTGSQRGDDEGAIVPATGNELEVCSAGTAGTPADLEEVTALGKRQVIMFRSIYLVSGNAIVGGAKLVLTGFFLLPCQFRLFSRLGAVSIVVPLLSLPCTLIVLPAVMLMFYPDRNEPDCLMVSRYLWKKASWLWT